MTILAVRRIDLLPVSIASSFISVMRPFWATNAAFDAAQNDLSKSQTVQELEHATARAFDAARAAGVSDDQLTREVKRLERSQKRQKTREGHEF